MAEYPDYIANPEPATNNAFLQMYAQDPAALRGVLEQSLSSKEPNTGMNLLSQLGGIGALGGLGLLAGRRFAKPLSKAFTRNVPAGNLSKLPAAEEIAARKALKRGDYAEVGLPAGLASLGALGGFFGGAALTEGEERAPMEEFGAIMDEIESGDLSAEDKRKAYSVLEKGLEARDNASSGVIGLLAGLAAAGVTLPRAMRRAGYIDGAVIGRQGKKALEDILSTEAPMNPQRYANEADMYIAQHAQMMDASPWFTRVMAGGQAQNKGVADAMHNRVNLTDAVTKDEGQALLEDMAATGFGLSVGGLTSSSYENPLAVP